MSVVPPPMSAMMVIWSAIFFAEVDIEPVGDETATGGWRQIGWSCTKIAW